MVDAGEKQQPTTSPSGERLLELPHGVSIRPLNTHVDDRGWLLELFNPLWGWHPEPLVHAYITTVRPGVIKGWGRHARTEDRYGVLFGEALTVLYDDRPDSPTRGHVTEVPLSEYHRCLINIPAGIWHAVSNLATRDFVFINFKTTPFDSADPDKFTLPIDTDQIPYRFPRR
jgi:dTDP-4-dehydrorhamnose 3,5-epimerase